MKYIVATDKPAAMLAMLPDASDLTAVAQEVKETTVAIIDQAK